jgi:enamine deaminase RidA (YjgF/YER057c/UK114 family)
MSQRANRLSALGFPLDRLPKPAANYRPLVVDGGIGYLSGALPFDGESGLVSQGSVPSLVSLAEAKQAAALCAANLLRVLANELGSLERIERVLRVGGYVSSDPGFTDQHLVVNGASELLVEVLGEAGRHARSAIGVPGLPLGASVEIDMIVRIAGSGAPS